MFLNARVFFKNAVAYVKNTGSPNFKGNIEKIVNTACKEAEIYAKYNIGGVLVENMHDIPYVKSKFMGPETVAMMTRVCTAVRKILPSKISCGVQILAAGNEESLAVAQASGCNFIRVEGFVFGHVADEGYIDACAGSLLRYRNKINSNEILIFTDIKKKHSSHAVTNDLSIEEIAKAAEFFLSDGVIITGTVTGEAVVLKEFESVKEKLKIPVIIGSGITNKNIDKYLLADALIIGSYFKYNGNWRNDIDETRVSKILEKYSS